jgi:hypothetical protein
MKNHINMHSLTILMNLYLVPSLLSLIGNTALGVYLFWKNPTTKVTYAFSLLILLLVGWAFSETMMRSQSTAEDAFFWAKILYLNNFFLPSAFLALSYVYAGGENFFKIAASYAVGLPFVGLLGTDHFVKGVHEIPNWGYDVQVGPLFPYFAGCYMSIIGVGIIILFLYYRQSSPVEQRKLHLMMAGIVTAVALLGITNVLSRIQDIPLPRMGSVLALVATVPFVYSMAKYKLSVVPTREKTKTTIDARCGALCSSCSSYLDGLCPSCEGGDAVLRESCPIYTCSLNRDVLCEDCGAALKCDIYREYCEQCPFATDRYKLKSHNSYLWEDVDPQFAFEVFRDYTIRGSFGLLITREYPEKVIKKYNLLKVNIVWLSQVEEYENVIDPTNLPRLTHTVAHFIKEVPQSFVLLTGLEYLIVHNGFSRVLKHLHMINDQVMTNNSHFLIVVDPRTVDLKELSLMEREMHPLKKDNLFKFFG